MPLYYFACPNCHAEARRLLTPEQAKAGAHCSGCASVMERRPQPPSARVTEVIDNGLMTRRLERLADAERLFAERNEAVKKQSTGES